MYSYIKNNNFLLDDIIIKFIVMIKHIFYSKMFIQNGK